MPHDGLNDDFYEIKEALGIAELEPPPDDYPEQEPDPVAAEARAEVAAAEQQRAIEGSEEQTEIDRRYFALHGQLLDTDGLRKIPPPTPLVDDYLFTDSLAWFSGSPGHYKSFGTVDIGCCVATGTPWHGHDVRQGQVLYLIAEGASGLSQRVEAWEETNNKPATGIKFLPVPVQIGKPETVDVYAFSMLLEELDPVLVIIDTQARVTVGSEENSNTDMGRFVEVLETLRRKCRACMLIVHHTPRTGPNLRGAVALEGAATSIVHFRKEGGDQAVLTTMKQKDTEEAPPKYLTLRRVGKSAVLSNVQASDIKKLGKNDVPVLAACREVAKDWTSASVIVKVCAALEPAIAEGSTYRSLANLYERGMLLLKQEGRSKYYKVASQDLTDYMDPNGATS